jgi:hypothetical protein
MVWRRSRVFSGELHIVQYPCACTALLSTIIHAAWLKTLDVDPSKSHVTALSAREPAGTFNVSWSGSGTGSAVSSFRRSEIRINGCWPCRPALGTHSKWIPFRSQRRVKPLLLEPMLLAIEAKEACFLLNAATDLFVILRVLPRSSNASRKHPLSGLRAARRVGSVSHEFGWSAWKRLDT